MLFDKSLLSTAYLPPIEYFVAIANSTAAEIEGGEMYQKQSYRTRCHINGANGVLVLTIPVLRGVAKDGEESSHKIPISAMKIDYSKPWLQQHKRALEAAYMSSPFFEYYMDELYAILDSRYDSLLQLNTALTLKIAEFIGLDTKISLSDGNYLVPGADGLSGVKDFRDSIHPKKPALLLDELKLNKPYYQVFTNKQGFVKNLSVLDLLFNEGPNSISFLEFKSNR